MRKLSLIALKLRARDSVKCQCPNIEEIFSNIVTKMRKKHNTTVLITFLKVICWTILYSS